MISAFPILKIEKHNLILREINPELDAPNYFKYMSQSQVNRFLAANEIPTNIPAAITALKYWHRLFSEGSSIFWSLVKEDNELIGTCGFNYWSRVNKRAEISYDLAVEYWNKGIMSSAVRSICQFAFNELQVIRIQATVAINNYASMKVLDNLGFQREGVMHNYAILHNKAYDYNMYAVFPNTIK